MIRFVVSIKKRFSNAEKKKKKKREKSEIQMIQNYCRKREKRENLKFVENSGEWWRRNG